jgi:hypothetical protein
MSIKKTLLALLALLALYLIFFPAPIDPVALNFPSLDLTDNDRLGEIEVLFPRVCKGCEDISFDGKGNLYSGHFDGTLKKFSLNGGDRLTEVLKFKGRPLGLEVLGDSLAWVAVEHEGLAKVDLRARTYEIVVNSFNDTTFMLIDYLDVSANGNVYFTDASDTYGDANLQYDILQGKPNGALYRYLPATGVTERLVDHLHFANGVVVDAEEAFVLVAETGAFRIKKHWMAGPKAGTTEIYIEGLPGWPDGISRGSDGLVYVTLISPRTGIHDFILPRPWTRRLVTKLPKSFLPKPVKENRILALDDDGNILHDWMNKTPNFSSISSVERIGDQLYFGTLDELGIGRIKAPK